MQKVVHPQGAAELERASRGFLRKIPGIGHEFRKNKVLYSMLIPGIALLLLFSYLPMFGVIIAFKDMRYGATFLKSLQDSPWIGLDNFTFFTSTPDAWRITRNTLGYNFVFIILGLIVPITISIMLFELLHKKMAKFYQSVIFLPNFLSWVVVSYVVYAFLHPTSGFLNKMIELTGADAIPFYQEPKYWPFILVFMNLWKHAGYSVVIYLAALSGIDESYYEAAMIDGASKWQQIRSITLPLLAPMISILTIMAVGRIFSADFGLFFNVPLNQGSLRETTEVIDTYVYHSLMNSGDIGLSSAAGLYQSVVGFILVLGANLFARKIDEDYKLF
ncbi:ABC transporter permease [Gorillibacterium timonense]|uniref:ABC transporter permease n=1 Tax=Gorillibacterium timonense TaxID=1689269 RepID=UPI0009EC9C52|nr:ABC transporter permease subunit [Gorillibacterium timonense]